MHPESVSVPGAPTFYPYRYIVSLRDKGTKHMYHSILSGRCPTSARNLQGLVEMDTVVVEGTMVARVIACEIVRTLRVCGVIVAAVVCMLASSLETVAQDNDKAKAG